MEPVWILGYQRTGSHYLSDLLNQTSLFEPIIEEWMNIYDTLLPKWPKWRSFEIGLKDRLQTLPPFCTVLRHHFLDFFRDDHKELIEQHLPGLRYIRLRRKDAIAVATSIYIARETNGHVIRSGKQQFAHKHSPIKYSRRKLFQIYNTHTDLYYCWDKFLEGSEALEVEYDDLNQNPYETMKRVYEFVGIDQEPILESGIFKNEHPMKQVYYEILEDAVDSGLVDLVKPPPEPPVLLL
jgi:LPS sulfotransferase NodH